MSVERWAVHFTHNPKTGRNDYEGMVRHPVGAYVAYADYKALTAELEAARRDAERYRWLRSAHDYQFTAAGLWHVRDREGNPIKTGALDAAIDAARQQEATNANG